MKKSIPSVANLTHRTNPPVNNSLHLGVANLTHLANVPVNCSLHLRCRKSDTPRQRTCKLLFTPPVSQI